MTGIYLHIPFCLSKCSYCDFYSITPDDAGMDRYLDALLHEINRLIPEGEPVDSIYSAAELLPYLAQNGYALHWKESPNAQA